MVQVQEEECDVLLVGFESQENLGLRSLAAYLQREGIRVGIQAMQGVSQEDVLARVRSAQPRVIGFSLIFQRMLDMYANLIGYLRDSGVQGHFTIGGHFPSFEFEELLATIPGLDSVVRHEGEETLCELVRQVDHPETWGDIRGLAFRANGAVHANPLRPLIADLDALPFPVRDPKASTHRGIGIRSLAGSRGCYYNCSFCSISEFYRRTPGPRRRTRSPQNVIREMMELHEKYGTRIFIFQDDDLFMRSAKHRQWLDEFLAELDKAGLGGQILWRISCRVDDLDRTYIEKLKASGLVSIYLGIESASDPELAAMNKGYAAQAVYGAIRLLRQAKMPFEFGFMLFTPDSTLQTVRENVEFLRFVAGEGDALIHFCKMAPYAGTPIQQRLKREGRLEGSLACPDYRFLDSKLDLLQAFTGQTFNYRNFDDDGLVERLRFAKFDVCVLRRFGMGSDPDGYEVALKELIRRCNDSALDTLAFGLCFIAGNPEDKVMQHWPILEDAARREWATEQSITSHLDALMLQHGFPVGSLA